MIGSSFKGLISTFPQSITSDLINYAPTMSLFMNAMTEYVKKTELQDGTFDLVVSSATVDGFVSCIPLSTTTSASIGSSLTCNSLTVSSNANIYGTLNGCNIATTSLSSLGTLPLIPVIKSDSIRNHPMQSFKHYIKLFPKVAKFHILKVMEKELLNHKRQYNI